MKFGGAARASKSALTHSRFLLARCCGGDFCWPLVLTRARQDAVPAGAGGSRGRSAATVDGRGARPSTTRRSDERRRAARQSSRGAARRPPMGRARRGAGGAYRRPPVRTQTGEHLSMLGRPSSSRVARGVSRGVPGALRDRECRSWTPDGTERVAWRYSRESTARPGARNARFCDFYRPPVARRPTRPIPDLRLPSLFSLPSIPP